MMIGIVFYLVTICACGYALAILLLDKGSRRAVEITAFSAALGCGGVPILLSLFSMLGMRPTRGPLVIILGISLVTILIRYNQRPKVTRPLLPKLQPLDAIALPGLALAAFAIAVVLISSLWLPPSETDAIAIWGLKAKVVFYEPLTPRPAYFTDLTLNYSHLDYPLLVPMLWAGAFGAAGGADESAAQLAMLAPFVSLLLLLYASLRRLLPRGGALLLTCIAVSLPAMTRWAGQAEADLPLALFLLGAAVMLLHWLSERDARSAAGAGLFAAMAAFTKLEGMVAIVSVILIVTTALILRRDRRSLIGWAACISTCLIAIGPWLIWSHGLPHTHENYGSRLSWSEIHSGLHRLPQLLQLFRAQMGEWSWLAVFQVLFAAALLGWRGWKSPIVLAIWFIPILQLLADVWAYLVTPWELPILVPMTASRLMLQVMPVMILLTALHWRHVFADGKSGVHK